MDMSLPARVIACVTGQKTCERLIKHGAALAKIENGELAVVHVARFGFHFLGNPCEGEALEYLFEAAKAVNAEMTVLRSDDFVSAIARYAYKHDITHMVVGKPETTEGRELLSRIRTTLPRIALFISEPEC